MLLSDVSVKRPVAALVLSMLLCVFGFVSFTKLAVREMPDIESPVVSISTRYEARRRPLLKAKSPPYWKISFLGSVALMKSVPRLVTACHASRSPLS